MRLHLIVSTVAVLLSASAASSQNGRDYLQIGTHDTRNGAQSIIDQIDLEGDESALDVFRFANGRDRVTGHEITVVYVADTLEVVEYRRTLNVTIFANDEVAIRALEDKYGFSKLNSRELWKYKSEQFRIKYECEKKVGSRELCPMMVSSLVASDESFLIFSWENVKFFHQYSKQQEDRLKNNLLNQLP